MRFHVMLVHWHGFGLVSRRGNTTLPAKHHEEKWKGDLKLTDL